MGSSAGRTGHREGISELTFTLRIRLAPALASAVTEGAQPRPAKPTRAGRGKRLQRCEKKVIVCLYSCCTFSFAQPSPLGRCSVLPQISCPAHIIRKSTTGKGHFSKCCFPVISNPPERRVQLFPYCLFFVSSFSLKALQELLGLLQTHGIVFCFGMDRG